jgi:hypothetical protein
MTDKEKYEKAALAVRAGKEFIELNRCVNCEHYRPAGGCDVHKTAIDDEYLYTPNNCPDWHYLIPF